MSGDSSTLKTLFGSNAAAEDGAGAGAAGSAARAGLAGYAFVSSRVVGRPSWKRRGQRGLRGLR